MILVHLVGQWLQMFQQVWSTVAAGEIPQLGGWAYVVLALLVLVEGPVATLVGAIAASAGLMRPVWVFAAAATGNLTADTLWYSLGYMGKSEWLIRWGRFFRLRKEHVLRLQQEVRLHALRLILIGKLTASLSIPALVATGLAKVPVRRWIGALILGEFIWTGALVFAGYKLGVSVGGMETTLRFLGITVGAVAVFITGRLWLRSIREPTSGQPEDGGGEAA